MKDKYKTLVIFEQCKFKFIRLRKHLHTNEAGGWVLGLGFVSILRIPSSSLGKLSALFDTYESTSEYVLKHAAEIDAYKQAVREVLEEEYAERLTAYQEMFDNERKEHGKTLQEVMDLNRKLRDVLAVIDLKKGSE